MPTSLTTIATRLQKLLLMLSSPRDGEVINAARAISRALQDAGADWHDLARALVSAPQAAAPRRESTSGWHEVMVDLCLQHQEYLRPRELEFCESLLHWRGDLTEKQASWLEAIYARIRRRTA